MRILKTILLATATFAAGSAKAADENPCPKDRICASQPETVRNALQEAGFRAKLDVDKGGDPMISSEASGYDFDIFFYGCVENKKCASLQFKVSFKPESDNTPEYANNWNGGYRFAQAWVNDSKELHLGHDVTTVGGLNQANFTDVVENWAAVLGDFAVFVKEQAAKTTK